MPKFAWPERLTEERGEQIAEILWTIYEDGPFEDEEGRATSVLMAALKERGLPMSGGYLSKTLVELESDDKLGNFLYRDINGKRTYSIKCIRKPGRDPFPPDPRRSGKPATVVDVVDDDIEEDEDDDVTEGEDGEEDTTIGEIEVLATVPGVELETLPQPSRVDRLLYMMSLLNELVIEEATAPERRFEEEMASRLTAVNRILEENEQLKARVVSLEEDKRKLAGALEQASAMMRDRAARNGGHGVVAATA